MAKRQIIGPGRRIKGNLVPFIGTPVETTFRQLKQTVITVFKNLLDTYRESIKYALALRMRQAVTQNGKQPQFKVTDESKKFILSYFKDHPNCHIRSFFKCILDYYNGNKSLSFQLNTPNAIKEFPACVQKGKQDCILLIDKWVNPIYIKLYTKSWENAAANDIDKFCALMTAGRLFVEYIHNLAIGELPKSPRRETYERALQADEKIKKLYTEKDGIIIRAEKGKLPSSCVSQECATIMFFLER